jgi:hypothetical protein
MNRTRLCFYCLGLLVAVGVIVEGQTKSPPTAPDPIPTVSPGTLTVEEEAVAAHWSQFGENYLAPMTVPEQIEALDLTNPTFLDRRLDRENYRISWQTGTGLTVAFNGQPSKLEINQDVNGHLNWQASVVVLVKNGRTVKEALEIRRGFVIATGESFVVQIEAAENTYRFERLLNFNNVAILYDGGGGGGACATCVCKALPPKGTCSTNDCDTSKGCTGGGRPGAGTCAWGTPLSCE